MDGTPVTYQRWDEDQPDSNAFDKNCVTMGYHMGKYECHKYSDLEKH